VTQSDQLNGFVRHPWIERFLANPDQELADFLAGYANVEPYGRAERPDAARLLFKDDAPALLALDGAVGHFLRQARLAGAPVGRPGARDRRLLQIMDALRLVSVLQLKKTGLALRKEFPLWRSWIERLPHSANIDVRAEYLSTLALTQRLLMEVQDLNRMALEPYWISVCEQSGGMLPETYLSIGLLGLRLLPERTGSPSERPWMTGLARWATVRRPPLKAFTQQWLMLKGLYPRPPAYWREAISSTLKQRFLRSMPEEIEDFWRANVGLDGADHGERAPKKTTILPPPREPLDALLLHAEEPLNKIILEARRVIALRERFAEVTGDSHFLVRSACNLGMRLLESGPLAERRARGKYAVELARKSLVWQPDDVFVWALWRDGLQAEERFEAAEFIGWEAVRRFPEDPQRRNQLALLLAKLPQRLPDAEQLLRETRRRFPADRMTAAQLANLLGNKQEAENTREAESLYLWLLSTDPGDHLAQSSLARVKRGDGERLVNGNADAIDPPTELLPGSPLEDHQDQDLADSVFSTAIRGGRLRRLAAYTNWGHISKERALKEVQDILVHDPNSSYAHYLHEQLTGQASVSEIATTGSFGVTFIDALQSQDSQRFDTLQERYPDPTQLYDLAKAFLFQDIEAAKQTINWLARRPVRESRPVFALRGFLQQRLNGAVEEVADGIVVSDLEGFMKLIAANDNIRQDLIEAALAPWDLCLAA